MEIELISIKKKLVAEKIEINKIIEIESKGLMSKVFRTDSNLGRLIIHLSSPTKEQKKQQVYKKIFYLSRVLKQKKFIPSAKVYLTGKIKGKIFLVQEYLKGEPLGDRVIKNGKIINCYLLKGKENYLKLLEEMIARLHIIKLPGYGFLKIEHGKIGGSYHSWIEFLKQSSRDWLMNLSKYKTYQIRLNNFFEKYQSELNFLEPGSLIHGDMINPGNVLIKNGEISGIIDFEWAAVGDPAWEFAFCEEPLNYYFAACKKFKIKVNQKKFLVKRKLYKTLWLLWGANVHAKGGIFKNILFKEFKKELNLCLKK